jgi:hypothetical protein
VEETASLMVVAEVAVALAGFSGVAAARSLGNLAGFFGNGFALARLEPIRDARTQPLARRWSLPEVASQPGADRCLDGAGGHARLWCAIVNTQAVVRVR